MSPGSTPLPQLQFVSKPMVSPFRDGSKCLVRDICLHLKTVAPHVMGTREPAPELSEHAVVHAVYGQSGAYSPALTQNLRAALFLLLRSRADLWHFVFSPNPRSSQVGAFLRRVRRVPTVQTIASPPRNFDAPAQLLFGDIAVAQSEWTRDKFQAALKAQNDGPRIEVILPPAPQVVFPNAARLASERTRLGLSEGQPLFVYPGDLEVSQGALRVVTWAAEIAERVPGARIVLAYRNKTERAKERALWLAQQASSDAVELQCDVPDIVALLATATAILFPVDDLYGKVDLPIVLLEAMRLGTPVLALDEGPLKSLHGALRLSEEPHAWLEAVARTFNDPEFRATCIAAGHTAVSLHYEPERVARRYESIYAELLRDHAQ